MSSHISVSVEKSVAIVTLDNEPRHNCVGSAELDALLAIVDQAASDDNIRVLVLTGTGTRTFSAGFDLKELAEANADTLASVPWPDLLERLRELSIPTIAALNGNCIGGGAHLALACDLRLGVDGVSLRIPAAELGLVYQPVGIKRMTELLGPGFVARVLLAGERMDTSTLLSTGFLHHSFPRAEFEVAVSELAARIADMAPLALSGMKQIIYQVAENRFSPEAARQIQERAYTSDDFVEGRRAKQEKRMPLFKGR